MGQTYGTETLEKNEENLLTHEFELNFEVDPVFSQTFAKLDDQNLKGLMLNSVPISAELEV